MNNTYLIQRLNKPEADSKLSESFSFGGGLKNGGLSEKAMELLRPIFSFDYMGSAEFEFGAIPEAIQKIVKDVSEYEYYKTSISGQEIFIISRKDQKKDVTSVIIGLSKNKLLLKEYSNFDAALGLSKWVSKENCRTFGWLEIDNGFFFFIDKEMAEKTANLFQLLV